MKLDNIKLDSVIHYDAVEVIYYTEESTFPKAFSMSLECQEEIQTYDDLVKHIQSLEEEPIDSMIIIAERGLAGVVVRWNQVEGLFQVGETRGYA